MPVGNPAGIILGGLASSSERFFCELFVSSALGATGTLYGCASGIVYERIEAPACALTMCLDELTAEVMKINVSPEMVTSEITVKLRRPSVPGVTYKAEAEVVEVSPPLVVEISESG